MSGYAEAVRFDERVGGVVVGAVVELPVGWAGGDEAEVVTGLLRRPGLAGLERLHVGMGDAGEVVGRVAAAIAERPRPALRELILEHVDFDPACSIGWSVPRGRGGIRCVTTWNRRCCACPATSTR